MLKKIKKEVKKEIKKIDDVKAPIKLNPDTFMTEAQLRD